MDLIGMRQHYLSRLPNRPLTTQDQCALQALLIAYVVEDQGMPTAEAACLAETFDFEIAFLHYGVRDLLVSTSAHYGLAGRHPKLVHNLFRLFTDPTYPSALLSRGYHLPVRKRE